MKIQAINIWIGLSVFLMVASCHPKPKLYEADMMDGSESAGHVHDDSGAPAVAGGHSGGHNVKVEEVLNTEKYSYLYVSEDGEKFWIAVPRMEVEIGGTYHYTGGLLKKNFESKEYNRVFEEIYLVSDIHSHAADSGVPSGHGGSSDPASADQGSTPHGSVNVTPAEGSIQLVELFSDREKYKDKTVQVTGKCVKVNPMIMGRNWVHIQDGSGEWIRSDHYYLRKCTVKRSCYL